LSPSLLDDRDTLVVPDAVTRMIGDTSGATGEDYLGYTETDRPLLYGLLQAAFAHLSSHHVLQPLDGASFRHNQEARRTLVIRMASQCPRWRGMGGLPRRAAR
jgi:hypothetical protein